MFEKKNNFPGVYPADIFPTDRYVSIVLKFSAAVAHNVEMFIFGEKASTIYNDLARKLSKNHILTN